MFQVMVMAVTEKKERIIKGDRCDPAKDPLTVKSVFSLGRNDGKIVNSQNLHWVNETCSFYRELEVGLLVRIPHHRR